MTRAEAGKLGGLTTLEKHGRDHFRRNGLKYGSLGGRPRALTIADLPRQQSSPRILEGGKLPSNLKKLKEMVKQISAEGCACN
jgi:hypothetical protein